MIHTLKIGAELPPSNTPTVSIHPYQAGWLPLVGEARRAYGPGVPEADLRVRRLAEQAVMWLDFARERSRMADATLVRKAIEAACFSVAHGAKSLAIPSKLAGPSKCQAALWGLIRADAQFGLRFDVAETEKGGLVVSHKGEELGHVQGKHLPWLRPLVPFGAGVYLARITGSEREGFTLGCNVVLGRVGEALDALLHALGRAGGDGAELAPEVPAIPSLVTPGPEVQGTGGGGDFVLWRDENGVAQANVPRAGYFSQTGPEWGYGGAGPAELALSILRLFLPEEEAHRLHGAYKDDVLEPMPWEGGTITCASVRSWIERERSQS